MVYLKLYLINFFRKCKVSGYVSSPARKRPSHSRPNQKRPRLGHMHRTRPRHVVHAHGPCDCMFRMVHTHISNVFCKDVCRSTRGAWGLASSAAVHMREGLAAIHGSLQCSGCVFKLFWTIFSMQFRSLESYQSVIQYKDISSSFKRGQTGQRSCMMTKSFL